MRTMLQLTMCCLFAMQNVASAENDPECGDTIFSGPNGFITSPQYSLTYPHNLNCLYSITGGQRTIISIDFISFSLGGYPSYSCPTEWLTVSCLSDRHIEADISSSRKYCGQRMPQKFTFPSCAAVVLNYQRVSFESSGVFKAQYKVIDKDSICGAFDYGPPSGVITFPMNNTEYDKLFDCDYEINATKPSSISLTIWSIYLRSSGGSDCLNDWLLIRSVDDQPSLKFDVTHGSCDHRNASVQLTFPDSVAIRIYFNRESVAAGKTFRIEYTVANHGDNMLTTELNSASISDAGDVRTNKSCAASGCRPSNDSTNCDCLPGDRVVNTQMGLTGKQGHAAGISLAVILVVIGVVCLGAFLPFRRHRKKKRLKMLRRATEEERTQRELDAESTKSESSCVADRNQDRDTSRYLPLRPISQAVHEEPSSNSISTKNLSEIQLCS